jgi:N12 class adenine-specific DNA methylase
MNLSRSPSRRRTASRALIAIRDCARTLIEYQTEDYPDSDIQAEQEKLNTLYDDFSKKIRHY